ncbi:MAG TPA: divalent cation tolerance protein CutA [Polyangiaceae bacterium]|nr:divalent cation tolerance protein CutA [Polyangiaceae bacterium]
MKIALTNVPPDQAENIARALVEERLVACVNAYPVRSTYRWEGRLEVQSEITLMMKVSADGVGGLRTRLRELHPYELPEFIVLDVDVASSLPAYVEWVRIESRGSAGNGSGER